MRLDLGRRADYALRAMVALARGHGGELLKARQIATAASVPAGYLPQVLAALARAGLVRSLAGPRGGYATARPPAHISVLDVIEAVGGPLRSAVCPLRGGPCVPEGPCGLHPVWDQAQRALTASLASSSLETVAASPPGGRP